MHDDAIPLVAIVLFFGTTMYIVRMIAYAVRGKPRSDDPVLQGALTQAEAHAARLEERIDQLERILDEDIPGWRARSSR
ncbi:envelope stress response membrane protein PspB [Gluconobacter morbifer]|uniref:Phage shock protein B n=1 Tax=Gluconobacter morbifer G707 TaxID=1088869 RepID=G6XJE1_9PROT|nr:envelope stress response membrane protein PspB [Gluconobacter morbifer]EHH68046.1 hypothetical protein GMO_18130 [Gluconobacter morbifer G707]